MLKALLRWTIECAKKKIDFMLKMSLTTDSTLRCVCGMIQHKKMISSLNRICYLTIINEWWITWNMKKSVGSGWILTAKSTKITHFFFFVNHSLEKSDYTWEILLPCTWAQDRAEEWCLTLTTYCVLGGSSLWANPAPVSAFSTLAWEVHNRESSKAQKYHYPKQVNVLPNSQGLSALQTALCHRVLSLSSE